MTPKTADLCDACEAALPCTLPFRSYGQRRAFAGAIRTIRCFEDFALVRDTLKTPGHGLVVDGGGSFAKALLGDVMATIAIGNGWAGLVIHGVIRDSADIDAMDIGVKALGTVPRRGERTGAGERDVPLHFGGVTFTPGCRLVADADGVIVLPEGVLEADLAV